MNNRLILLISLLFLLAACQTAAPTELPTAVDDPLTLGATIYARECAECHGANLEGEPNWQQPHADGAFRSPPHDAPQGIRGIILTNICGNG